LRFLFKSNQVGLWTLGGSAAIDYATGIFIFL